MSKKQHTIYFVGPFPPPVYGMSTTNLIIFNKLKSILPSTIAYNTSASNINKSLTTRLQRLIKITYLLFLFTINTKSLYKTLYISAAGGKGQVYDIFFILIARIKKMRIFIRHCSFAYLDTPSIITQVLTILAGKDSVHITQSYNMANRLKILYKTKNVLPISNVVLYQNQNQTSNSRTSLNTVGFLSNISSEKGAFIFLDLINELNKKNIKIHAKMAGPFQSHKIRKTFESKIQNLPNIEYLGPLYGNDKENFYKNIDAFIFPTCYKDETEAKVNHEAMSYGVPVIAYGRGCIPEIISPTCGKVINPKEDFISQATKHIQDWIDNPETFQHASKMASIHFTTLLHKNNINWLNFQNKITNFD